MTAPSQPDLLVRPPAPAEISRALYLFHGSRLPAQARLFVAVKTHPMERFVAAAAWWPLGPIVSFRLAVPGSGATRAEASRLLIEQIAECGRALHLTAVHYADLLAEGNEWIEILKASGFTPLRAERFFEMSAEPSLHRTLEIYEKHRARIPAGWRTESIRNHPPETILDLIAPYRLMPPEELRECWRANSAFGFDLDLSSILFDGAQPLGTMLARRVRDALCIDIRVVRIENQLLRALGNVLLFHHMAARRGANKDLHRLEFRGGEVEHRETANLALRMGGRELPPRQVFARAF